MDVRDTPYFRQVDLLLQVLPVIAEVEDFALKGGTAINLFLRNLPRLSVDIDLTYLPVNSRETALQDISKHLKGISSKIQRIYPDTQIVLKQKNNLSYGLTVKRGEAAIKVEPNTTLRGTLFPPTVRKLSSKAEELFGKTIKMQNLSTEDLYAGKLCAALDRQHPRDLYDVYFLLQNEGLTKKIRQTFIVYLLSHNRPISELLNPQLKDNLKETFEESFEGMTFESIPLETLISSWKMLVFQLNQGFSDKEKEFILGFKRRSPVWSLLPFTGVDKLPAIRWKMLNLKKMSNSKHRKALAKLEKILE